MGMYFTCPVCAEGRFSDRRHDCPGPRVTVHVRPHVNSRELVRSVAEGIGVPMATLAAVIEGKGGKVEPPPAALHDPLDADLDEVQRRLSDEAARRRAGLPAWSGQSVSPKAASAPPLAYPSDEGDQLADSAADFRSLARDLRQRAQLCLGAGQNVLLGLALRAETLATDIERLLRDVERRPSLAPDGPGDPLTLARESTHRPADKGPRPTYPPTGWGEG